MSDITAAPKGVVAFGRRNANEERIKQAEEELEQLKNPKKEEQQEDIEEPTSAEEKSFKKRYGDLRRFSQQKEKEYEQRITALEEQLAAASKKEMKLPKTEEEINAWASQYPDVYKLVKTIAIQQAKEQTTGLEERMNKITQMEREAAKEKAEAELMRLHPDFDQIREDDAFHEWVEQQPKWIQDALYENDSDARSAARAIDLYKADVGIKTKKASSDKDAASAVGARKGRSAPVGDGTEGMIYESQIQKMSASEYERNLETITEAMKNGKFVYDISGAAR